MIFIQNLKTRVVSALKTATALYTLISDRVYFHYPNSFNTLPAISYFEYSNVGDLYADDQEIGSEIIFQIDIWNSGSTSTISQAVDIILTGLGFTRIECRDLFESNTAIHHKMLKYRIDYSDPNF